MDFLKLARLQAIAFAERNGIPVEHSFTADDLAPAHEQLDEAERDLYGEPSVRISNHDMDADQRADDQHRGAVPRTWSR